MSRDRILVKLANFILRFTTPRYKKLLKGSIIYGLQSAHRDTNAAGQPALGLAQVILEEHVIPCPNDDPERGRCPACQHEALQYAQTALAAIDATELAEQLQNKNIITPHDPHQLAQELKSFLATTP